MGTLDILAIARRHLGTASSLFYAPEIPAKKLAAARAEHAVHLPESEPILVLYDVTVLGGGDEGFLATPERLCWRNFLATPRQVQWRELDPATVVVAGPELRISGGQLHLLPSGPGPARLAAFLLEAAAAAAASGRGPYRGEAPAGPLEDRVVVRLARRQIGDLRTVHYAPSIPPRKAEAARRVHTDHLPPWEDILVLHDATVFGGAAEGFVLTGARLCWKNAFGGARHARWTAVDPTAVVEERGDVRLGSERVVIADETQARCFAALFAELARLAH